MCGDGVGVDEAKASFEVRLRSGVSFLCGMIVNAVLRCHLCGPCRYRGGSSGGSQAFKTLARRRRTPTKPSAFADPPSPPATDCERDRRKQRTQPGGLGVRLRLFRIEDDDEEELPARRNARQPSFLPSPTPQAPLPQIASEAGVSKEPSWVVSGHACACIEDGDEEEEIARAPKRTPTKPSAAADLASPPATDCERDRRQQRAQPGGLGVRGRLHWPSARREKERKRERERDERRGPLWTQHSTCCQSNRPGFWFSASTGMRMRSLLRGARGVSTAMLCRSADAALVILLTSCNGSSKASALARRNARQPSPLPPPTSLGPLPKFASESDVSKEPSQVVSGHACACIGLRTTRMEMMRKSCSRAETHASQAPCLRRPRSAPCQSLRARPTSAKNPAGWSRGTLVLALPMKMIEMEEREREPLARQDARRPSPLPSPTSQAPLPQIASEADGSRELSRVVLGYASLVRDAREARECT